MSSVAEIEERLAALVAGELATADRLRLEAELDDAPEWIAVLATLIDASAAPSRRDEAEDTLREVERAHRRRLRAGTPLGPYEIVEEIGRGGMGTVYAARDPRLRRTVALKVLGAEADPSHAIAEARATARVHHPNVVEVFDAGRALGRTWIAMERLDGTSLAVWRELGPHSVTAVLEVFVAAGRGLAAAHEAGLVHRDFKPSNVFVTARGRVVVLDFGLATVREPDTNHTTAAVAPAGTPAYMAPEQVRGTSVDARADQFAFAVALHETLLGTRPDTARARTGSRPAGPRAVGTVPRRVRSALARALAVDPDERFADMPSLLAALRPPPRRRGFRWVLLGLGALAVVAWATDDPCARRADGLAATWGPAVSARVAARFADAPELDRRLARLDEFVADFHAHGVAACRRPEPAARLARTRCLEHARRAFEAVVTVIDEAGGDDPRTLEATDTLPDLQACLRRPAATADADASADDSLDAAIARVDALRAGGRVDEAVTQGEALVGRLDPSADPATAGRAHLARGLALRDAGRNDDAEAALWLARDLGTAADDDETVAHAYVELAWVVGVQLSRHDEGRELVRHADAWSQRLGRPPRLETQRGRAAAWLELDAGRHAEAIAIFEATLHELDRMPDAFVTGEEPAMLLNGLGAAALGIGDVARAITALERAADILARQRGDLHLSVAKVRNNLAAALRAEGRPAEAIAVFDKNVAAFGRALGPDSLPVAQTLHNRAVAHLDVGEIAEANADAEASLRALEHSVEPDHPMIAKARTLRGDARLQAGDPAGALEDFAFALEHERESLGDDHPSVANVLTNMASAYYELGEPQRAIEHHREALAVLERAHGEDHSDLAFVLVNLGLAEREAGDDAAARASFQRAIDLSGAQTYATARTRLAELLLDHDEVDAARVLLDEALAHAEDEQRDPVQTASTWFALARATEDPVQARRLAASALQLYREHAIDDAIARVETWLRAHPEP